MRHLKFLIIPMMLLLISGCAKKIVEVPVNVKTPMPILSNYEIDDSYQLGKLHNEGNKVCVHRWDSCIPKTELLDLIEYIKGLKTNLRKYQEQTDIYNAKATLNNSQ